MELAGLHRLEVPSELWNALWLRGGFPQLLLATSCAGAEIDLLLTRLDGTQWAIDAKRSATPKVERCFQIVCQDILPTKKWLIYPGTEVYPLGNDIMCLPLDAVMHELAQAVAK